MATLTRLTTSERDRLMRVAGCTPACAFVGYAERTIRDGENYTRLAGNHNGEPFVAEGTPAALKAALAAQIAHPVREEAG